MMSDYQEASEIQEWNTKDLSLAGASKRPQMSDKPEPLWATWHDNSMDATDMYLSEIGWSQLLSEDKEKATAHCVQKGNVMAGVG